MSRAGLRVAGATVAGAGECAGAVCRADGLDRRPFPELDALLAELVAGVESILGNAFVGAYLTRSFVLGTGDLHSDCDFLVVTEGRVTAECECALRALHRELPTRAGPLQR